MRRAWRGCDGCDGWRDRKDGMDERHLEIWSLQNSQHPTVTARIVARPPLLAESLGTGKGGIFRGCFRSDVRIGRGVRSADAAWAHREASAHGRRPDRAPRLVSGRDVREEPVVTAPAHRRSGRPPLVARVETRIPRSGCLSARRHGVGRSAPLGGGMEGGQVPGARRDPRSRPARHPRRVSRPPPTRRSPPAASLTSPNRPSSRRVRSSRCRCTTPTTCSPAPRRSRCCGSAVIRWPPRRYARETTANPPRRRANPRTSVPARSIRTRARFPRDGVLTR